MAGRSPRRTRKRSPSCPKTPDTRQLTDLEKQTGWKYAIIATNVGLRGLRGVPGSHQLAFIDAVHRDHAEVEDRVRCNKAMGLRNLPSKTWNVNVGWVLAANLAADFDAWTRLLGLHDDAEWPAPSRERCGTACGICPPGSSAMPAGES